MGRLHPEKYPAKAHLKSVANALPTPLKSNFIFLKGASLIPIGTSDQFYEFTQESNFYYCSGSDWPDWYLLYDIAVDHLTFLIPPQRSARDAVYFGQFPTIKQVKHQYDVDAVVLHDALGHLIPSLPSIFYTIQDGDLISALTLARSVKDRYEEFCIQQANDISSAAHHAIAVNLHSCSNESHISMTYHARCTLLKAPKQAYSPIIASGKNASILHYAKNDADFGNAELVVVDAAVSNLHYAADVTRTYPISGTFSVLAKELYQAVLTIQKTCIEMIRPGARMSDIQRVAMRMVAEKMVCWKWVNCSIEEVLEKDLASAFLMHGIGHHIGLDVHDVTPLPPPLSSPSSSSSSSSSSDTSTVTTSDTSFEPSNSRSLLNSPVTIQFDRRQQTTTNSIISTTIKESARLAVNSIVTIEPGIYFNHSFLALYYAQFPTLFNVPEIEKWQELGGVRIEDCVVVLQDGGHRVLTEMVKEVDDIEALCRRRAPK